MNEFNFEGTVKEILKERGLGVGQFCEQFGTSHQNLNRLFRANSLSTNKLIEIANFLKVDVRVFFNEKIDLINEANENNELNKLRIDLENHRELVALLREKRTKAELDTGNAYKRLEALEREYQELIQTNQKLSKGT